MTGEALPQNMIDSLMGLSPKQLKFITDNIDPSVSRYYRDSRKRLGASWARLRRRLEETLDSLETIKSVLGTSGTSEDRAAFETADAEIRAIMVDVRSAKLNGLKNAIAAIERADEALKATEVKVRKYLVTQTMSSRDFDSETAIAKAKALALADANGILVEFTQKLTAVTEAIQAETGAATVSLGYAAEFRSRHSALRILIEDIPQTGPDADIGEAQGNIDDYLAQMRSLMTGEATGSLEAFTGFDAQIESIQTDPRRAIFVEQEKRRIALDVQFAKLDEVLEQMDRWDSDQLADTRKRTNELHAAADSAFPTYGDIVPEEADELASTQTGLIDTVSIFVTDCRVVFGSQRAAFQDDRDLLLAKLVTLEDDMAEARGSMSKSQRDPIEAYLGALRTAVMGLGGCNLDALKPAQAMIPEAEALVEKAQQIDSINTAIKKTLEDAKKIAKPNTGATNPLAAEFTELVGKIDALRAGYKDKAISTAQSEANQLQQDVVDCKSRNEALIARRAGIDERIVRRAAEIRRLNDVYLEMLAKMDKPLKDYEGSFYGDLEACRAWNTSKTNIAFYTTIDAKLDTLRADIVARQTEIREFLTKHNPQAIQQASIAGITHGSEMRELNLRKAAGEDVSAEIARANEKYQEAAGFLDVYHEMSTEQAQIEQAAREETRLNEVYKAAAVDFLKGIVPQLKDAANPLSNYADEVKPQIDRVKSTYDLVKGGKPGASGRSGLSELSFVEKFIAGVKKRGFKTDKSDLVKIGEQWRDAVGELRTDSAALVSAITDFEGNDTAAKKIETALKALVRRVATNNFTEAGYKIANAEDRQLRKAGREEALSEVRRCRSVLFEDPLFAKCVLNPFSVPFASRVADRLGQIELNVLRGI